MQSEQSIPKWFTSIMLFILFIICNIVSSLFRIKISVITFIYLQAIRHVPRRCSAYHSMHANHYSHRCRSHFILTSLFVLIESNLLFLRLDDDIKESRQHGCKEGHQSTTTFMNIMHLFVRPLNVIDAVGFP